MNHDERKLKRLLQEMQLGHEVKKQRRKAAQLRRSAIGDAPEERFDGRALLGADADDLAELDVVTRSRRRRPPAARVQAEARRASDPTDQPLEGESLALVSSIAAGVCRVRFPAEPERESLCRLAPDVAVRQRQDLAVGDEVRVSRRGAVLRIESVAPRRTRLARPDPTNPYLERVLAANVDLVVVATAVQAPGIKPGLIDRVLLAARSAGCDVAVCVNKIDLATLASAARDELLLLSAYADLGIPVFRCSARTGEGLAALAAAMHGRTSVLVGQSGCGKSSLVNALAAVGALVAGPDLPTGASRQRDGKGRHTTTASSLRPLPRGGFLIDTPGVRQFGLWRPSPAALEGAFPDVAAIAAECRYRDCGHASEPDCAVRAAVADGTLAAARVASFRRLSEEL